MPKDHAVVFRKNYFHKAAAARTCSAFARARVVSRAVTGAQQPLTTVVKNPVGLPIQFHRHMATSIQVSLRLTVKPNTKSAASLPRIQHIERNGQATLNEVGSIAQRLGWVCSQHVRHGRATKSVARSLSAAPQADEAPQRRLVRARHS